MSQLQSREHAHALIDQMAPGQLSAFVSLLEIMLDPFVRTLPNAPYDDEPVTEKEARDIAAATVAFACGEAVSHEELLSDLEFTRQETVPSKQMDWEQFFLIPSGDVPHHLAVAAVIESRGDW